MKATSRADCAGSGTHHKQDRVIHKAPYAFEVEVELLGKCRHQGPRLAPLRRAPRLRVVADRLRLLFELQRSRDVVCVRLIERPVHALKHVTVEARFDHSIFSPAPAAAAHAGADLTELGSEVGLLHDGRGVRLERLRYGQRLIVHAHATHHVQQKWRWRCTRGRRYRSGRGGDVADDVVVVQRADA